jgi:hypothetical protein
MFLLLILGKNDMVLSPWADMMAGDVYACCLCSLEMTFPP